MEKSSNVHIEKDKWNAPYLLAASFHDLVKFVGSSTENGILHWHFIPVDKVKTLIEAVQTKKDPRIPAKDIFEAIETFWRQVSRIRNERNGRSKDI
ncbi:hypothetical protein HY214_03395 [Candidatus Roizmanbacteria bacterium]|nr:hypothetical protein [Candidatus Roizmanbacteria bacterium]